MAAVAVLCFLACAGLRGQYFGQNKVRHQVLKFQVLRTKHFDIYFYPDEKVASEEVGRMAERWYTRYTKLFHHVLTTRQPVILYASHTDFEQTTVVPGFIQEGTGGVTLAQGRKVVIPLAGSLAATDHVLGHELVHAYQYDMTLSRGSPIPLAARLPLWFIEGMAEYCSLGPDDANTAMWMRDAIAHDRFPTIKDLNNPNKYFPYRFGEAFWAFVGGKYGDDKIAPMLLAAAASGSPDRAIQAVLHITPKQLSAEWKRAALAKNQPILQATRPVAASTVLVAAHKKTNSLNVSPALSPNGKWVMFFSERGLFSIELYLANAQTGQVVRRITSTAISAHFNNLEFINSAGAWAPDSRRFAFGHVQSGVGSISIYDVTKNQIVRRYPIPGVGEVFSPTWSPDGKQIAFSAIQGGLTNLYLLNLQTGAVRKLTDDAYAELQPAWSPAGNTIAFVTDRFTTNLADLSHGHYRLALLHVHTGAVQPIPAAESGNQINPQWSPGGKALYYISDASGIANVYLLALGGGDPEQLTNLQTGVSGITALSPALTVAGTTGAILYSEFSNDTYSLVRLPQPAAPVTPALAQFHPALLAPRSSDTG
ncbi:MAG: peptidase MA family metallohydrolase, partial [Terriglobales bacterium]